MATLHACTSYNTHMYMTTRPVAVQVRWPPQKVMGYRLARSWRQFYVSQVAK